MPTRFQALTRCSADARTIGSLEQIIFNGGTAVINADDAYGEAVEAACRDRGLGIMRYGQSGEEVRLVAIESLADGHRLELEVAGKPARVALPLLGGFQASNALCALALALASGDDAEAATAELEKLQGVPGRVQLAGRHPAGAPVYDDYAHTPAALACVLKALRPHAQGRLHLVFGCGGDRDSGKRPEMGAIAGKLADVVIVTDDNPRTEDAADIRAQILAAVPAVDIGDRAQAIAEAVNGLGPGDLLGVAGKGHEQGQIIGEETRPFDDAEAVGVALKEIGQ